MCNYPIKLRVWEHWNGYGCCGKMGILVETAETSSASCHARWASRVLAAASYAVQHLLPHVIPCSCNFSLTLVSYFWSFSYLLSYGGDWFNSLTLWNCLKHLLNHSFISLFKHKLGFQVSFDTEGFVAAAEHWYQYKASLSGGFLGSKP
jgi:hypothetical protein